MANEKKTPEQPEDAGSGVRPKIQLLIAGISPMTSLELLLNSAKEEPKRKSQNGPAPKSVDRLARARAWLEKADPSVSGKGGHNNAIAKIERVVRGFGLTEEGAFSVLKDWNERCQPPWSEAELRHKIKDGLKNGDTPWESLLNEEPKSKHEHTNGAPSGSVPFDLDPRPIIRVTTELHFNVDLSVAAISEDPNLYQRDAKLVHVTRVTRAESEGSPRVSTEDDKMRPSLVVGSPQITLMALATLRERLTRFARFEKYNERSRGYKKCLPTDHIVSAVHARGEWPMRELVGITETPTMRPDGSIVQKPGYDAVTGYLYEPAEAFPPVPDQPTQADACKALLALNEIFVDFPYVSEAARSVPIAAILTLVARPAIEGAVPAFIFDASTRGSGKTLQTDAIAMVASGRMMPRMNFPIQEDELEKVLGAYALRGALFFSLDNVTRPFGGGALDRVITARDTVELRVLGKTEIPTLSWRAVVFATGNNMSIYADTARRILIARLEPTEEHPEQRTRFAHDDLPGWTRRERARLVVAALTLLRAFFVAGAPPQDCARWGSFEEWSRLIPQAIVWAGGKDPMGSRPGSDTEVDTEAAMMQIVLTQVHKMMKSEHFRTSYLVTRLYAEKEFSLALDACKELCQTKVDHVIDSRALARKLSRYKGRVISGFRLNMKTGDGGFAEWSVVDVSNKRSTS